MKLTQKVIEYKDDDIAVTLVLSRASGYIGFLRGTLISEAIEANKTETDNRKVYLHRFVYPDCIASVAKAEGFEVWPILFDDFIELPEQLVNQWAEAVNLLNPHWQEQLNRLLSDAENEIREKKAPT